MAKYTLTGNSHDLDFVLIGISSAENQYSIVSHINNALGIDLVLSDNVPFNLKDGKLFYFSLYKFVSEEMGLEYYLTPNTSNFDSAAADKWSENNLFADLNVDESTRLVKELPKTDYFLILKGEELHLFQFKIMDLLKSIKEIIQLQNIEPNDLPSKMNLIF
ncbi:MAG: IPExxxVDY family protein [Bacteroidetes bacterium]|nr:IPExxxVDY family protein [Bacteroidota bacterium]